MTRQCWPRGTTPWNPRPRPRADGASPRRSSGPRVPPALMRLGARQLGRRVLDPDVPWELQRRRLDRLGRAAPPPKGTMVVERELDGVRAKLVSAGPPRPGNATVVHFHGGGYCVGSAYTALSWAAWLSARTACQVVLPEYRLAPEHPYPAALDDARTVMNSLFRDIAPTSLIVSGDSAGGGLALASLLALRDEGRELPAGCILLSPWLDLSSDRTANPHLVRRDVILSPRWLEACATAYARPSAWPDPSVSPLNASHADLPPLLIQAGTDELLAPDAERLAASACAAGVDVTYTRWPRMWHDFSLQPGMLAAADSALSQAAWFARTVTGSDATGRTPSG